MLVVPKWIPLLLWFLSFGLCEQQNPRAHLEAPVKVEILEENGRYELLVDGTPFDIKGVGVDDTRSDLFKFLSESGANAVRTWSAKNAGAVLDSAKTHNLMVALGVSLGKELYGFDYNDETAVKEQFNRVKATVDAHKDHPNLLAWVLGNELNLLLDDDGSLIPVNPKTYLALAEMVDYIHKVDPNHPVTTTFAGTSKKSVDLTIKHAPDLDFLSYQVYSELAIIEELILKNGSERPYMITEYGPKGHWEMPITSWGREIEEPNQEKAEGFIKRINQGIVNNTSNRLIGHFAFFWGWKQESTSTWYGLIMKDGSTSSRIDELTKWWTGEYPTNRAPGIDMITLDGRLATDNISLKAGQRGRASIEVTDVDGDELQSKWFLKKEVEVRSEGGAYEEEPETIDVEVIASTTERFEFTVPGEAGEYRLFVTTSDGHGKVGYANIPFLISAD